MCILVQANLPLHIACIARSGVAVTRLLRFRYSYKNVLKYRTRGRGISILVFDTIVTTACRPLLPACGTPDRAIAVNWCFTA
jgi:hypothetical protein